MKKEVFKSILVEWFERKLPSLIERELKVTPNKELITAIIGPRRVGKTYLMFFIIENLLKTYSKEEIIFIDFEDNRLSGMKPQDLDDLFVAHSEISSKKAKYLFFDEIQEVPQWSKFLRRLNNLGQYNIVISGSSSKLASNEVATELRGRYKSHLLLPFSFTEFLRVRGFTYDLKTSYSAEKKGELNRLFEEYTKYGGYPQIVKAETITEKRELAKAYFETIFYKDILERYTINNRDIMEMLMNYILSNNSSTFSTNSFNKILKANSIKASTKTISLYLKYLEESFFVLTLQKFSYSARIRLMNPKKIYLADNCFQTFLSTNSTEDKGKLLESLIMQETKRRNIETYYFKETKECDFILKQGQSILSANQVTYELSPQNQDREINGLLQASGSLKTKNNTIITLDQKQEIIKDKQKIHVQPAWKWLLENEE
ncbi:MAG: ATP-binding protein [Candidatus Diapherotrites archaeon]|nr:ATP-binding protein [Candidatus Diapherotrites archaeon]